MLFVGLSAEVLDIELADRIGIGGLLLGLCGLRVVAGFHELARDLREQGVGQNVLLAAGDVLGLLAVLRQLRLEQVSRAAGDDLVIADALAADFLIHLARQLAVLAAEQALGFLRDHLVALTGDDVHNGLRADDLARRGDERRIAEVLADTGHLSQHVVIAILLACLLELAEQAKRYGVLYCLLRDKNTRAGDAPVDIIARAEDASKIQRICDRFELGKIDKAGVVSQAEKDKADRDAVAKEVPTKTRGEIIVEQAMGDPVQKEGQSHQNPTVAKTEKSPPSERSSTIGGSNADRGTAKQADKKPSVREKLERYKAAVKADKEADRTEPSIAKERPKAPEPSRQTVHRQPKRTKKPKER